MATCPICGKRVDDVRASTSAHRPPRPFCSTRCRQIDLGKWLNEDYRIPTDVAPEDTSPEHASQGKGDA